MTASNEAEPAMAKLSILLDPSGHLVGVSKPKDYKPQISEDEQSITAGIIAELGQSLVEVEVPAEIANLDGAELLSRLAHQNSVLSVIASIPTAGQASWSSFQAVAAVPSGVPYSESAGVSAGQGTGPVAQSLSPLTMPAMDIVTAGLVG
jgi:hypothetical protein